jgi:CRISPR-associated protein Cas6
VISPVAEMIDAVFDVSGDTISTSYPLDLWESLVRCMPNLEIDQSIGVIPLRTTASEAGMLLPKRAKLTLRLPTELSTQVATLSGLSLDIGNSSLQLGSFKLRAIQPYPTLHAHLVNTEEDEVSFVKEVHERLDRLGIINAKLICGLRNRLAFSTFTISGFSLVIHDLKPEDSLRLQYIGLGADRRYGCGIFVPYKVISDLS